MSSSSKTSPDEKSDALGGKRPVERGSFRDRMRRKPGIGQLWRVGVFVAGLLCVAAGGALIVLPGPLTIPPILLGLWIWSTEFKWAYRFLAPFKKKAADAWEHAKKHPVTSTIVTVGGLVMAGAAIWATSHYELVAQVKQFMGLS